MTKLICTPTEFQRLNELLNIVKNKAHHIGTRRIARFEYDNLYKEIKKRNYRMQLKNNIFFHPTLFSKYIEYCTQEELINLKTLYYEWKDETRLMGSRRLAKTQYFHLVNDIEKRIYQKHISR